MSKKVRVILLSVALVVLFWLLFPIKSVLQDGGTIRYRAVLYEIVEHHELDTFSNDGEIIPGNKSLEIRIFPWNL